MALQSSAGGDPRPSLLARARQPGYADAVLTLLRGLPNTREPADAVAALDEAARRMGCDVAAFVSFVRDDGSHESFRFLLACDPTWCHEYERRGWYANDPWLDYALNHSEPRRGYEIAPGSRPQREVAGLASQYGFVSAVIVPAPSSRGLSRVGVLCLGSWTANYFDDEGYLALKVVARSVAMEFHEWWIAQVKREVIANAHLSEDDLVLLRHEWQNHKTKVIARELGTTRVSIDSRFQRLTEKLGVPNRRAAAVIAAEYGLI
jgi:Autoinducer binding domain